MDFHPAANFFPMMSPSRFEELKADISNHGQRLPITVCEGMILDGRNRYRACLELSLECKTEEFSGNPWEYVWSLNGPRRDLPDLQKAAIKHLLDKASELWTRQQEQVRLEIEAGRKKKISEAAKAGDVGRASAKKEVSLDTVPKEPCLNSDDHPSRTARAKDANVSTSTQAKVEWLASKRTDLLEKVASGEIKGTEAFRQMKKDEVSSKIADLPDDKFTVIYADPPWSYNDKMGGEISDSYGAAEKHYPSMSMAELKALDIPKLAAQDAVLFLWATSPLLPDALELCMAWGFKYKAAFIWDKVKHNMGHYNSVRHEFLLVSTKGSCTPENVKLFDSVQTIERTEKHSQKPEEFRKIIETLYPSGKKIELFARVKTDGWVGWGNEA